MHYHLSHIPPRSEKPRTSGLTMVMDKGLSTREAEDLLSTSAAYIDFVKLGWATSYLSPNMTEKLELYRSAGVPCYFGGTLFELFLIRNQIGEFRRILQRFNMEYVEISDGSLEMAHEDKCAHIRSFAQDFRVLSEVGSKDAEKIIAPYKWIAMMKAELEAGSERVIAEAREAGNVGIFRSTCEVRSGLVDEILTQIPAEKILWEAPHKTQQTWFIKLIGCDVNLGNIASNDVIPLETLRLGLRSDTFHQFLSK